MSSKKQIIYEGDTWHSFEMIKIETKNPILLQNIDHNIYWLAFSLQNSHTAICILFAQSSWEILQETWCMGLIIPSLYADPSKLLVWIMLLLT